MDYVTYVSGIQRPGVFLIPLVDMEVLGQVCCQAGRWGGPPNRLQVEVVRTRSSHAEILEVEIAQSTAHISSVLRIGYRCLKPTTPMAKR